MIRNFIHYFGLVTFSHTVFALPFALMAFFAALRVRGGGVDPALLGWVLVCMVTARTAAMAFNRIVDRQIDARNPRTRGRHLPRGILTGSEAWALIAVCSVVFLFACSQINTWTLVLSPVALGVVLGYSLAKYFTPLTHFFLGLALALAPVGAWIAVLDSVQWAPLVLGLGVLAWVAGFDILYSLQDEAIDRREGLYSLPVSLGRRRAMRLSSMLHGIAVAAFMGFGALLSFGPIYFAGVAVVTAALWVEHRIISPEDIRRVNAAFFTVNGFVSLALLAFTLWELYWGVGVTT